MNPSLVLPAFAERDFTLTPTDDRSYLLELALSNKYNKLSEKDLTKSLGYIKYVWVGETKSRKAGVIFLCYIEPIDWWTLDAYKDDSLLKVLDNRGDFSYRSGTLITNWFMQTLKKDLYTVHEEANRAATVVSKRIGFKEITTFDQFIILKKELHG